MLAILLCNHLVVVQFDCQKQTSVMDFAVSLLPQKTREQKIVVVFLGAAGRNYPLITVHSVYH
jgi:hypothetical protein